MSPTEPPARIRPATASDCQAVACLYAGYVRDSLATFELVAPSEHDWRVKLQDLDGMALPFLVALQGEELVGYALATPWRSRPGYRFTVEDSIYVHPEHVGQGWGRRLMAELIAALRSWGARQVIAVIADSGEPASLSLHVGAGFAEVGRLRQVGFKQDRWVDTVLFQLNLVERSGGA